MKINYNEDEDYCIYICGLQSGKTFIFRSLDSDSIHMNNSLLKNKANVLSYTSIYEKNNIIGIKNYMDALKPKLNDSYLLEFDLISGALKHVNDILKNRSNHNVVKTSVVNKIYYNISNSHHYILNYYETNNINYKLKNILTLPPGKINIFDFFEEEIKKYNLKIINHNYEKFDYEWMYEKYVEEINANFYEQYDANSKFELASLLDYAYDLEEKFKKLYGI